MKEEPTSKVIFFLSCHCAKINLKKRNIGRQSNLCLCTDLAKKMTIHIELVSSLAVNLYISTRIRSLNGQNPSS